MKWASIDFCSHFLLDGFVMLLFAEGAQLSRKGITILQRERDLIERDIWTSIECEVHHRE